MAGPELRLLGSKMHSVRIDRRDLKVKQACILPRAGAADEGEQGCSRDTPSGLSVIIIRVPVAPWVLAPSA